MPREMVDCNLSRSFAGRKCKRDRLNRSNNWERTGEALAFAVIKLAA